MLSVSEKYTNAVTADARNMLYRVKFAGALTFDQEKVPKMSLEESVSGSSNIAIGTANSATLKFTLKDAEAIDYSGMMVEAESGLELPDGTVEYVPLGKFWVTDFSTSDNYKTVNFTCADGMYHMTSEYESELTYPAPITSVISEIASKAGVAINPTFELPDITVRVKPPKMTLRDAIGHIAGCMGCNARFNRLGALEFFWYEDCGVTIPPEIQYLNGMTKLTYKPLEVNFEITGQKETYTVNVMAGENGGVTATPGSNIHEGDTVVLSINPFNGYEVATVSAITDGGESVTLYQSAEGGYTFIQPDSNVNVTVSFRANSDGPFEVTTRAYGNGTIRTYTKKYKEGTSVIAYILPDDGYELDKFTTIPANVTLSKFGTTTDGEIMYEFIMPQSDVTINAYFKAKTVYYPISNIVDYGEFEDAPGAIYVQVVGTRDFVSEAVAGTQLGVTFFANDGYAFDYYDSNVPFTQISDNSFIFTMPAEEVSIVGHFKLSEDETKTGKYSWLQMPQTPPTSKPYWAVFYRENFNVPVWQKFYLVWFDSWEATGYNMSYGKQIFNVQFNGYYYCGSDNTGDAPHAWSSTWSGNGTSGSTLKWGVFTEGYAWSGATTSGSSSEYCLLATNANLFRNGELIFERCEKAIQSPQTSYIVNGIDVRELGSLTRWKCPDTFSTPAPASHWMIVDASGALCMIPENDTYYDADSCDGLYVVFFDSITVENVGAVFNNSDEEFYLARVTNGHYCLLALDSRGWTELQNIAEGDVLGLRSPLVSTSGTSDYLGVYHFSGILASSVDIDSLIKANSSRICDCASTISEVSTFSLRRSITANDAEQVTISYTNPFIYEKMVSDISANVNNITYTPAKVKYRGNPAVQAGDIVTVPDNDGVDHTVLVMQQTLNFGGGMNAEISCFGQTNKTMAFSSNSSLSTKVKNEVEKSSLDLEHRIAVNNALVYAALYKNINSTEAKITSVVEWQTEKTATIASIEQTANSNEAKISLVVGQNGLVNESGAVQGSIVIQAINGESSAKISADRLDIEGKTLNIKVDATNIQGEVTARIVNSTKGNIGGWTIENGYLWAKDSTSGRITAMQAPSEYAQWVFAAGGTDPNSYGNYPFRVHKDGTLYATGAHISGVITAKEGGSIGGFNIGASKLEKVSTITSGVLTTTNTTIVQPGKIETHHYDESSDKTSTLERSASLADGMLKISVSGSELPSNAKPIMQVTVQGTVYTIGLNTSTKTLVVS